MLQYRIFPQTIANEYASFLLEAKILQHSLLLRTHFFFTQALSMSVIHEYAMFLSPSEEQNI